MDRKDFIKSILALSLLPFIQRYNPIFNTSDMNTEKLPVLFIGHGNPMNALQDNDFTKKLKSVGSAIKEKYQPKGILMVSAHWLTKGVFVCSSPKPETIHDFGGFPKELFDVQYPAAGSPEFAGNVSKMLANCNQSTEWGLDHGAWTILKHLFPKADVPVFQLSIDYYQTMQFHFDLAKQLKTLRQQGVLIIGSGNIVHALNARMTEKPYDWAIEFDEWAKKQLDNRNYESLIQYEKAGASAKKAFPTPDHYIPLLYTLGATEKDEPLTYLYEGIELGIISMRCLQIG